MENPCTGWNTTGSPGWIGPRGVGVGSELGEGAPTATDPKPNTTRNARKARTRTNATARRSSRPACTSAETSTGALVS